MFLLREEKDIKTMDILALLPGSRGKNQTPFVVLKTATNVTV